MNTRSKEYLQRIIETIDVNKMYDIVIVMVSMKVDLKGTPGKMLARIFKDLMHCDFFTIADEKEGTTDLFFLQNLVDIKYKERPTILQKKIIV